MSLKESLPNKNVKISDGSKLSVAKSVLSRSEIIYNFKKEKMESEIHVPNQKMIFTAQRLINGRH